MKSRFDLDGSNMTRVITVQYDKKGNKTSKVKTNDDNIVVGSIVEVHRTLLKDSFYCGGKPLVCWEQGTVKEVDSKYGGSLDNLDFVTRVIEYHTDFVPNDLSDYLTVTSIDKDTIQIQKKGKDRKFKEFIIPSFDGKKVVIANNGFQKCNFGTITFECNVIRVGKDAFAGSTIKKIKNYKKVNYLNVEDDVLRLNLLKYALKDYKKDDKKSYLNDEILAKDLITLLERTDDKSIFNSNDEIGYAVDRIHGKNLTNYIDFGRSNNKLSVLKTICTGNAVNMKQIENNQILSFVKDNYESLLKTEFENVTVLLVRKDIYQSWAGFPNSDQSICELISKIVTTFSSIKNAFSDHFCIVNYSDYGADSFIEDCQAVLDRCIKNNCQIDIGYSWSLGRELTLNDVVDKLPSLIVNK